MAKDFNTQNEHITDERFHRSLEAFRRTELSHDQRAAQRDALRAYARFHSRNAPQTRVTFFPRIPRTIFKLGIASLVLAVATAGTATYAAARSLPGDTLYPIKISVIEPIEGAFAITEMRTARFETVRAERRVAEFVTLDMSQSLSDDEKEHLLSVIEDAHARADRAIARVADEAGREVLRDELTHVGVVVDIMRTEREQRSDERSGGASSRIVVPIGGSLGTSTEDRAQQIENTAAEIKAATDELVDGINETVEQRMSDRVQNGERTREPSETLESATELINNATTRERTERSLERSLLDGTMLP